MGLRASLDAAENIKILTLESNPSSQYTAHCNTKCAISNSPLKLIMQVKKRKVRPVLH
jgi:hypothetical protein